MQIARILGWVFIAIGILGFIPGITTSDGMLLGVFEVDAVHNIVHLIVGILLVTMTGNKAVVMAIGILYILLGLIGLFVEGPVLGFLTVNMADNWLHLIGGAVLVWAGMKLGKTSSAGQAM